MSTPDAPARPHVSAAALATAISVATACTIPGFLTGALGVQLREALDFGEAALGVAVGSFFASAALASAVCGRLTERLGAGRSMRLAVLLSATSLAGVALFADSLASLVACLMVAGVGNAVAQPATNLFLARAVDPARQGLAFGVKQSAIPTATLLGGLAVPIVALTVGWRWAFAGAAATALAVAIGLPALRHQRSPSVRARRGDGDAPLVPLLVLSVGSCLGAAAAGTLGAFLVSAAVDAGIGEGAAGYLLTGGSATGIAARLYAGVRADRRGHAHLPVVALLLAVGSGGYLLYATGEPLLLVAGTPLAFAAGWGWPGLFNLAIVRNNPTAPGAATGITQTGTYLGAVAGPLQFRVIVEAASYDVAWLCTAATSVAAAGAVLLGRRMLLAAHARRIPAIA